MRLRPMLPAIAGILALGAYLAPAALAGSATPGLRASTMPTQVLAISIHPVSGAAHGEHVTAPTFAVEPGLAVHVTFTNYTRHAHTFTIPGLGVSALIQPAKGSVPAKTVVTFTANRYGTFTWECLLCPDDSSSSVMKGRIYAIIQV